MVSSERMRFPRPGLALLPPSLRSLIRVRIRHPLLSDGSLFSSVEELGAEIWSKRSLEDCKVIATAICSRLSHLYSRQDARLAALHPPVPDPVRTIELLPVSEMLLETLKRQGFKDTQELSALTIKELLDLPAFGARRVLELLAVLDQIQPPEEFGQPSSEAGVRVTQGNTEDMAQLEEVASLLGTDDILLNDIRFRELIAQLRTRKNSLKEALGALRTGLTSTGSSDPWVLVRPALKQLVMRLKQVREYTLTEELLDLLKAITTERKAEIVAKRLGWHDGHERTLQEVGDLVGLTRERVRQMEARAQQKLTNCSVFAPSLQRALKLAKASAPCTAATFSDALKEHGLASTTWNPGVLVRAAQYFGIPHGLVLHQNEGTEFLANEGMTPDVFARVRRMSWSHSRTDGAACLVRIGFELSEELERRVSLAEIRSIVSSMPETRWIDEKSGWYWLGDHGNTTIFNTIRKMLSISKRISMDDLYEGILKSYRMDESVVAPKSVILKMLSQVPWIRIKQSSILSAQPALHWQEVLNGTERIMVQVLKEAGGVLDHPTWKQRCVALGVSKSTFMVYQGNDALFVRLLQGVWTLRGVEFDGMKVVEAQKKNAEFKLSLAIAASARRLAQLPLPPKFASSEKILQLYQVTASAFKNHCVTFARLRHLPAGTRFKVILDSKTLGQVGITDDGRLRGLIPHLKRAGVLPGEAFVAQFDLADHVIRLERLPQSETVAPLAENAV